MRARIFGASIVWSASMAFVALTADHALAQVVDQSFIPPAFSGLVYSIAPNVITPLGQEFRPTLASLDFVDLWIGDGATDIGSGASVMVSVHTGAINGPTVGTSTATFVPDGTNLGGGSTLSRFKFTSPLLLVPGSTYVLDVFQTGSIVPGNQNFGWGGSYAGAGTYPDGRMIVQGNPREGSDFWFREGVLPEPGPVSLLGAATMMGIARRRRRQSQASQLASRQSQAQRAAGVASSSA